MLFENVCHVLFECSEASRVWNVAGISFNDLPSWDLVDYMERLLQLLENERIVEKFRRAIPWLIWGIC